MEDSTGFKWFNMDNGSWTENHDDLTNYETVLV